MCCDLPEDGGHVTEVGETAQHGGPGVGDDRLEDGLGQHAGVVETLHHLNDLVLVLGVANDDILSVVNVGVEEVENVYKLLRAWREVLGGENTGVLSLPQEVQKSPGELLLHLPVCEVPRVLHLLGPNQTPAAADPLHLARPPVGRHSCRGQTGPTQANIQHGLIVSFLTKTCENTLPIRGEMHDGNWNILFRF